jgi:hypothetical protein
MKDCHVPIEPRYHVKLVPEVNDDNAVETEPSLNQRQEAS